MDVMSTNAKTEPDEPAQAEDVINFPPLPEPNDDDFDEGISEEEKAYYRIKFADLKSIVNERLHCTACDRHLGCSVKNENRMKQHPMLRTLMCATCHSFYNSGEFDKGDDGSELYCRWCGQGGQVYCCSDCPHVFCAKCIKRNFGPAKIKEIENTDDWKCFKCSPECLRSLRSICWALLRYCDLKNNIICKTEDLELKEKYIQESNLDLSLCCKSKIRRREKNESSKKKEKEAENIAKKIVSKMPPTIQVKKFASINSEDLPKVEPPPQPKKPTKRSMSPKQKAVLIKNPISIVSCAAPTAAGVKKFRMTTATLINPVRFSNEKKLQNTYSRLTPRPRTPIYHQYNGYNNTGLFTNRLPTVTNDNINLSLDSLTQGLDFSNVTSMDNESINNDVVCTPDFPLEPLCEVTEDPDDDVQCMTPGPVVAPMVNQPPPLVARTGNNTNNDNIIQMTDNDVTVNAVTGGLKFRVDPQTLSSNKMYRLPDGRVFAINVNPNMPGGYSATIVSVSETTGKVAPKGETFAAKLSTVVQPSTPMGRNVIKTYSNNTLKKKSPIKKPLKQVRECDMKVSVEWYRYNLIDAIDALEYSLLRLNKVKKDATTIHLRSRTVDEMKYLHKTLDQLLTTTSKRFSEIRENLNVEFKQYLRKKTQNNHSSDEEDDDVLILPDEEPISIDENSMDSINGNESHDVDLTEVNSSEQNDSVEARNNESIRENEEHNNTNNATDLNVTQNEYSNRSCKNDKEIPDDKHDSKDKEDDDGTDIECDKNDTKSIDESDVVDNEASKQRDPLDITKINESNIEKPTADDDKTVEKNDIAHFDLLNEIDGEDAKTNGTDECNDTDLLKDKALESNEQLNENTDDLLKTDPNEEQLKDADMSDETIESLLKDNAGDGVDNIPNLMDISDLEETQ